MQRRVNLLQGLHSPYNNCNSWVSTDNNLSNNYEKSHSSFNSLNIFLDTAQRSSCSPPQDRFWTTEFSAFHYSRYHVWVPGDYGITPWLTMVGVTWVLILVGYSLQIGSRGCYCSLHRSHRCVPCYTALPAGQIRVLRQRNQWNDWNSKTFQKRPDTRAYVHFFIKMIVWLLRPTLSATSSEPFIIDFSFFIFFLHLFQF